MADISQTTTGRDATLHAAARKLEARFLSEMLKPTGLGAPRDTFGGGPGEGQFASFLREAYAEEMARTGGIGLAQPIYEALRARDGSGG